MLGRTISTSKKGGGGAATGGSNGGGDAGSNARLLQEIEALSRALSLDPKSRRRSLPSSSSSRSISAGRGFPPDPKENPSKEKKNTSSPSSSSIWSWKPFKALSHIGRQRIECVFSLHVHSIKGLPSALEGALLAVHWRRTTEPQFSTAGTRLARVVHGDVEFDETLSHRCSIYASKGSGSGGTAKYESRQFAIHISVDGSPGLDLGRHIVDLTRILPLSLADLWEEKGTGRWSTGFKLSGKARGAVLNFSFGYVILGDRVIGEGSKRLTTPSLSAKVERQASIRPTERLPPTRDRNRPSSRSVEDIKILHEVPPTPSSKFKASDLLDVVHKEMEVPIKCSQEINTCEDEDFFELKKSCRLPGPLVEDGEKDPDELQGLVVVEQGLEFSQMEVNVENLNEKHSPIKIEENLEAINEEISSLTDEKEERYVPFLTHDSEESICSPLDAEIQHSESSIFSVLCDEMEYRDVEFRSPGVTSHEDDKSKYKSGGIRSKSLSMDDLTESIASEFLASLGYEHSPFCVGDMESPREQLWRQYQKESLTNGAGIFDIDVGDDLLQDLDLSAMVLDAEAELERAAVEVESKTKAKMLEDAETEALMREWGLNEEAFQHSPPGNRSCFGSPNALDETVELPSLGSGLGPFIQTKDGGFLRTMSPTLFKNAKNSGCLIMQVSNPVVVPAEMGAGILEILQGLASIGIEKLSMQASKLMPLEDITGKTMHQVAWEASPAKGNGERQDFSEYLQQFGTKLGSSHSTSNCRGKSGGFSLDSCNADVDSEYVSLEDLAPLAMDKIEALSMEGLRIQSGMSGDEAPSNIAAQHIGEMSSLEGKGAKNNWSLGLEGTAGLQLMDVKDSSTSMDGLIGLSITLDEWMKLDSGIVDDEDDQISDRTSKILAAHHAKSAEYIFGGKHDKNSSKRSGKRWGFLGNNFTVALMVQLRDPLRNYEPVGTPMLALVQVERVFVPPKPKIYGPISERFNSGEHDEEDEDLGCSKVSSERASGLGEDDVKESVIPQFKIAEVHVAGLKTEPEKRNTTWGNPLQQQSGSRWLLASGMGKSNKHPFMKSKASVVKPSPTTPAVQPGDTFWSISTKQVHGGGAKWKDPSACKSHVRNPNVVFPNEKLRFR